MGKYLDRISTADSAVRKDYRGKCDGSTTYISDIGDEDLLLSRVYRSTEGSAEIVSCSLPELPAGYFIIGAKDIAGKNFVKIITEDQRIFADKEVTYIGEPIFLVVGEDMEVIEQIMASISIEYKKRTPIFDFEAQCDPDRSHMVSYHLGSKEADVREIEQSVTKVMTEEFHTPRQEHVYLEPQALKGSLDEQGRILIEGSLQCPYYVKNALMSALDCGDDEVRIIQTPTGGAFGGKEEYPSLIACQIAVAVSVVKKPILLAYGRREDMRFTTKRHPALVRYRTSLDEKGRILGMNVEVYLDGGANEGLSSVVLQRALINCIGVYDIPNVSARGFVVFTNNVPNGAFRGFGAPQTITALEAHLTHIARDFSVDPLDYKKQYVVVQGSPSVTGGRFRDPVLLKDMIDDMAERIGYKEKKAEFAAFNRTSSRYRKGLGHSLFLHGCGFTGSGERDHIKATVRLEKNSDDEVIIRIANVDMGQGLLTTMSKIVGETLGIDYTEIRYPYPDTLYAPDSGPTVASRTTMIVGRLLERAAQRLKEEWKPGEKQVIMEHYVHDDTMISWNQEKLTGDAYPAYSWGVNMTGVTVDTVTGKIDVDFIDASYDIGRAIDERIIRGQIDGGLAQSFAYGYLEHMESLDGVIRQQSISDYGPPTSMDVAPVKSHLYDNPYINGPMGAKGAGELTFIGGAPAVLSAAEDALGLPFHRIPLSPENVLKVLNGEEEKKS